MTLKNFDNFFLNEDEDSRAAYDRWWEETQPKDNDEPIFPKDEYIDEDDTIDQPDDNEEELRNNLIRAAGKYVEQVGKDKLKELLDELYPY